MLRWTHPESSDWLLAPPLFVPESAAQFPDSAAGVVVVLSVAVATGDSALLLLDAETMALRANLSLPVKLADTGLHNHYSEFPTST